MDMFKNSDLKNIKFSVLMSVYSKEKPEYLEECFESLLRQTCLADEWVVVKDGPLTDALEKILTDYKQKYPNLITFVPLEENKGLGLALKEGIIHCRNELIARMDTDDICINTRFERQLKEFLKNPNLDICGSYVHEFEGDVKNIVSTRRVPLTQSEIEKYQKKRSAFNHMTVMFKKQSVLNVGNYEHAPLMEDDMLWTRLLLGGATCKNIDEVLVYARVGVEMITRRGGYAYYKKYQKSRKKIYKTGFISYQDYLITLLVQLIVCLVPKKVRLHIFKRILR